MTNAALKLPPLMTADEFLDWPGDGTGSVYDLVEGVPRAQDAASDVHGTIVSNLVVKIGMHLRAIRPGYRTVLHPGIRPHVRAQWNHRVPDLGVTCTPTRAGVRVTPDPLLLIEVLSPSNKNETWDNVVRFTTIPSVQEILVVDSTKIEAVLVRRNADGTWPKDSPTIEPGGMITLTSIDLELVLSDAYLDTYFNEPDDRD